MGQCGDASHYYGKLVLTDIAIEPKNVEDWSISSLGQQLEVSYEMTLAQAKKLDAKDHGMTYQRLWKHGQKKSERFDSPEAVLEAGIKLWQDKQQELGYGFPFISLYEGERDSDLTVELVMQVKDEKEK